MSEYWELLEKEKRRKEFSKVCKKAVEKIFGRPKGRFKIKRIMVTGANDDRCLVDFIDNDFEPDINCEEYCGWRDDYDECMALCQNNLEFASTNSVVFDPKTFIIDEATIAQSCYGLWMPEMMDEEDFKEMQRRVKERFEEAGCFVDPENFEWVHPHELVRGAEWDLEDPAVCYVHPTHIDGKKCKLDELVKVI